MVQTVLIISSESTQRELLTHALQNRLGYSIIAAASAREAARYFHPDGTAKPDLILLDWPQDTQDVESHLNSFSTLAPLVALVKYGDYDAAVAALNAGAQDFLTKPVAIERLGATLRTALLLRDARRELEWLRHERTQNMAGLQHNFPGGANGLSPLLPFVSEDGNIRRMEEIEAEAIRFAMQYYHGRMTEVARRLGIGRSTLYRKLSEITVRPAEAA